MTTIWKADESYSLTWKEGDLWYGYVYNDELNKFIFDDTGHELITGLWDYLWRWDGN